MPQSQDIHLNDSKSHRGQTVTTAGQSKHLDACMRLWQDMRAPAHASLAQEMHTPKPLLGACITCVPPFEGVQDSQSHFDQPLRHSNTPKCSSEDALHTDNQPIRMQQPR